MLLYVSFLYFLVLSLGRFFSGWWYTYPSEKYEFVSWDDDIPNIWQVIKFHGSKPPTSWEYGFKWMVSSWHSPSSFVPLKTSNKTQRFSHVKQRGSSSDRSSGGRRGQSCSKANNSSARYFASHPGSTSGVVPRQRGQEIWMIYVINIWYIDIYIVIWYIDIYSYLIYVLSQAKYMLSIVRINRLGWWTNGVYHIVYHEISH